MNLRRLKPSRRVLWRWTKRAMLASAALTVGVALALTVAVRFWSFPTSELSPDQGGPLIITDRHGEVIRKLPSAQGHPGREAWLPLSEMPPLMVSSFLVSEDAGFFEHSGVDWRGVARAALLNLRERRAAYGGSTITMQLVRMIRSPGKSRTISRKVSEAVLAMRLERALSKSEILEQYLNRAYFGNGAYGVQAAAKLYFGKPARVLSDGEATLLAVLPRAPSAYNPIAHPGAALRRRDHVFGLLKGAGKLSDQQAELIRRTTPTPRLHRAPWRARHFTEHVLSELPDDIRARGGELRTTIDLAMQERLEQQVADHVAAHATFNLDQAGLVVLNTQTGEVLAMVGSAGWESRGGQVNIATRRRHPGSALKPFIYALAMESGATPATIAYDIPDVPSAYKVVRLTQKERGPVRYREALAGSYNLAAVHTLELVGVSSAMSLLRRAGVGALEGDEETYGLRLALGSAKVRLIDLANGYRMFARGGRLGAHRSISGLIDGAGNYWSPQRAPETRLISPETAWLTLDMLADPEARRPAFGDELPVDMRFPIAVKTGTSRGFADTVTVAVTDQFTVAAWGGNVSGEPTQGLIAMAASAPLVRAGLLAAAGESDLTLPPRPASIESAVVCPVSGLRQGPHCTHGHNEHFASSNVPTRLCDWHRADGSVSYPQEVADWAARVRERGGQHLSRAD